MLRCPRKGCRSAHVTSCITHSCCCCLLSISQVSSSPFRSFVHVVTSRPPFRFRHLTASRRPLSPFPPTTSKHASPRLPPIRLPRPLPLCSVVRQGRAGPKSQNLQPGLAVRQAFRLGSLLRHGGWNASAHRLNQRLRRVRRCRSPSWGENGTGIRGLEDVRVITVPSISSKSVSRNPSPSPFNTT
jgi:hypothetical protein